AFDVAREALLGPAEDARGRARLDLAADALTREVLGEPSTGDVGAHGRRHGPHARGGTERGGEQRGQHERGREHTRGGGGHGVQSASADGSGRGPRRRGSRTVTRVSPGALVTAIRPACASTIAATIARP